MAAFTTSAQVVNASLQQIASQVRIGSLSDTSAAAQAANVVYAAVVQLILRELDPDFARLTASLSLAAGATPPPPWAYEYTYPADCVRVRQVRPPASGAGSLADPYDPVPVLANVAFDTPSSTPTKVILTNQQGALAVYTTLSVTEPMWDSGFSDAVVRRLANPLAMALSGRPDFARNILEESAAMVATCETIDESAVRRFR